MITGPLAWGLAASIAANLALGAFWLDARDTATTATERLSAQATAAQACSAGVKQLETAAQDRQKAALAAIKAVAPQVAARQRKADAILSAPPAVPGNDCASAQVRIDAWLGDRGAK